MTGIVTELSGYNKSGRARSSFINNQGQFKTGIAPQNISEKYNLLTPEQKTLVGKRLGLLSTNNAKQQHLTEEIKRLSQTKSSPERNKRLQRLKNIITSLPVVSPQLGTTATTGNNTSESSSHYSGQNKQNEQNEQKVKLTRNPLYEQGPPVPQYGLMRLINRQAHLLPSTPQQQFLNSVSHLTPDNIKGSIQSVPQQKKFQGLEELYGDSPAL